MGLYTDSDGERIAFEADSKGTYRSPYRRDYARLIHSPAFRRLQGKTQLFPGVESDFFRNRLTHSLEVAQVAKSIALRLNTEYAELKASPVDPDIVEFAALAHDLGHPPFGHNGEAALDRCMLMHGGFEGNAQTLRILTRLEKKGLGPDVEAGAKRVGVLADGTDKRAGLNLTARAVAAVLKYDQEIPLQRRDTEPLCKGYYASEASILHWVRGKVLRGQFKGQPLKTIECQIMDLADDIAYSTYDLEDAFKAGFLTPLSLIAFDESFRDEVAKPVAKKLASPFTGRDVLGELILAFPGLRELTSKEPLETAYLVHNYSDEMARNGYARTTCTSDLVNRAVEAVRLDYSSECPILSRVYLEEAALRRVETLKRVTYNAIIQSPRLKVTEYRGGEIVQSIFEALADGADGSRLLPDDFRELHCRGKDATARMRTICDFIAGMTDAYALEFYSRLKSVTASSIFRPF